jgi:hypothetical protein
MKKFIKTYQTQQVRQDQVAPSFHRKFNQESHLAGEIQMNAEEEFAIYYRLAKEFIDSRLGIEPTDCRITYLANTLREIDAGKCFCENDC